MSAGLVLSERENELLTQVGAGTPMGELLRRYWHPIAAVAELDDDPIKEVTVLGESLVVYRDLSGRHGLVDRRCAHRGASLVDGMVEACGIRCSYHGWAYDHLGRCVEQPFEQTVHPGHGFRDKVKLKAYPAVASWGLVWAYLGPEPAPCLPDWEFYHRRGYKLVWLVDIPCNWFQCQENTIDPVHFEWLHDNWSRRLRGNGGDYSPAHLQLRFDEFDYGFVYGRVREGSNDSDPLWSQGRVSLWPNGFLTHALSWRVPVDAERTLLVALHNFPVPGDAAIDQARIHFVREDLSDVRALRRSTRELTSSAAPSSAVTRFTMHQDVLAMTGQGRIADRSCEQLGESDRGIIQLRRRFLAELERVARGEQPKAIIRDPANNDRIVLPFVTGAASHTTPLEYFGAALSAEARAEIERIWPGPPRRGRGANRRRQAPPKRRRDRS